MKGPLKASYPLILFCGLNAGLHPLVLKSFLGKYAEGWEFLLLGLGQLVLICTLFLGLASPTPKGSLDELKACFPVSVMWVACLISTTYALKHLQVSNYCISLFLCLVGYSAGEHLVLKQPITDATSIFMMLGGMILSVMGTSQWTSRYGLAWILVAVFYPVLTNIFLAATYDYPSDTKLISVVLHISICSLAILLFLALCWGEFSTLATTLPDALSDPAFTMTIIPTLFSFAIVNAVHFKCVLQYKPSLHTQWGASFALLTVWLGHKLLPASDTLRFRMTMGIWICSMTCVGYGIHGMTELKKKRYDKDSLGASLSMGPSSALDLNTFLSLGLLLAILLLSMGRNAIAVIDDGSTKLHTGEETPPVMWCKDSVVGAVLLAMAALISVGLMTFYSRDGTKVIPKSDHL